MNLRRTLALIFPPVREVVETRDSLYAELQLANARINDSEHIIHVTRSLTQWYKAASQIHCRSTS